MSDEMMDNSALMPHHPSGYDPNVDYIISDYMERLGTRLNILETELKYAWRALDLLSQEYIKMWERLEKLESLLYEQQSVIAQLLDFYTTGSANQENERSALMDGRLGELEVIREILGNGTVEDGLEEGVDVTRHSSQSAIVEELMNLDMDDLNVPDEAFYRSLNAAYREDLMPPDAAKPHQQLGMIWEEREESNTDTNGEDKMELRQLEEEIRLADEQDVYSAMDYKDYRGNSPCVSEQDLAQLSRISSIDKVAVEKLNELDRLSVKLQQDSFNIKQLQRKLLESPHKEGKAAEVAAKKEELRPVESWSFSNAAGREQDDMMILGKSDIPTTISYMSRPSSRPSSRISMSESMIATDNEVSETLASGSKTPTSPRRRQLEVSSCSAPYTTVQGRLAYSAAVHHAESVEAAATASSHNPFLSMNPFYATDGEEMLPSVPFETIHCSTPSIFSVKSERAQSPTLSICSIRTRQDGYIGTDPGQTTLQQQQQSNKNEEPSPPPPAPQDISTNDGYLMPGLSHGQAHRGPSPVFLGADASPKLSRSINSEHGGRLSPKVPHSPKSPRTSPKRSKSHSSTTIHTAKSDSGLSSMSGWSSLEKSPGSPKNGPASKQAQQQAQQLHYLQQLRSTSPNPVTSEVLHVPTCSAILPGGHHLSAFTTVKSPCSLDTVEGYGTFVPAPAPASDINVSPRPKPKRNHKTPQSEETAIYSMAGSNKQDSFTSVYTSNNTSQQNHSHAATYPDLVQPYECSESQQLQQLHAQREHLQQQQQQLLQQHQLQQQLAQERQQARQERHGREYYQSSPDMHAIRRKSLNRSYSTSNGSENIQNHDGYKTAMQRTMFPSGNITDALTYYPTSSSRYESMSAASNVSVDYNDPSNWLAFPPNPDGFVDSASTSSSMRSMDTTAESAYSPYMDQHRRHPPNLRTPQHQLHPQAHLQKSPIMTVHQHPEHPHHSPHAQQQPQYQQNPQHQQPPQYQTQPIYQNQQEVYGWNQRQDVPYLELDLQNRNVPEYLIQQHGAEQKYYDSGVIVSQAGYISCNMNEQGMQSTAPSQKSTKKLIKRGSIKSAMNSVSHWLPDLHLSKRNRSYSLPGNSRTDEETPSPSSNYHKKVFSKSSLNKKKKKIVSTMSGILQKAKRKSFHHAQSLSDPEQSESEWGINRASSMVSEDDRSEDSYSMYSETLNERENLFEKMPVKTKDSPPSASGNSANVDTVKLLSPGHHQTFETSTTPNQDTDVSDHFCGVDEEISGKSTGSGSSGIFATVGENKRNSGPSDKSEDSTGSECKSFPPVTLGGASMEFAVSRALGKYRQRQTSSSICDEFEDASNDRVSDGAEIPQPPPMPVPSPTVPLQVTSAQPETAVEDIFKSVKNAEPIAQNEGATNGTNGDFKKGPSLLEQKSSESSQSFEIQRPESEGSPASSFRAQFGRMSRHQASLEIPGFRGDDDDNRSTHSWRSTSRVSSRRQSTEDSIDSEDEWYCYELRKLEELERQTALEAEIGPPVQEVEEVEESYQPDEEVKEKMSFVLRELKMIVKPVDTSDTEKKLLVISSARARGQHLDMEDDFAEAEDYKQPIEYEDAVEAEEDKSVADDSSGATSGPDSPQRSISEFEEAESAIADEFARCRITAPTPDATTTSSVSPKTTSPKAEEAIQQGEISPADVPKIKIEVPVSVVGEDDGKDSGPLGSKWKLLKALKERKAEEKNNQEKVTDAATEKEKVGSIAAAAASLRRRSGSIPTPASFAAAAVTSAPPTSVGNIATNVASTAVSQAASAASTAASAASSAASTAASAANSMFGMMQKFYINVKT